MEVVDRCTWWPFTAKERLWMEFGMRGVLGCSWSEKGLWTVVCIRRVFCRSVDEALLWLGFGTEGSGSKVEINIHLDISWDQVMWSYRWLEAGLLNGKAGLLNGTVRVGSKDQSQGAYMQSQTQAMCPF
jgi:hypothetical protein